MLAIDEVVVEERERQRSLCRDMVGMACGCGEWYMLCQSIDLKIMNKKWKEYYIKKIFKKKLIFHINLEYFSIIFL